MMMFAIFWLLGAFILLIASRRMWIDNELKNRWQCVGMCLTWPLSIVWSWADGARLLVRKIKGRYLT